LNSDDSADDAEIDLEFDDFTLLYAAAQSGSPACVESTLLRFWKSNSSRFFMLSIERLATMSESASTCLDVALYNKEFAVAARLLAAGVRPKVMNNDWMGPDSGCDFPPGLLESGECTYCREKQNGGD
jgi:hypothetical protein